VSAENDDLSGFDKFATTASHLVARAPFFAACVALVVLWVPTLFLLPSDSAQILINTPTTIVTFLLVALLQNTDKRSSAATAKKLNAIAAYLAGDCEKEELRKTVGLEDTEGA
jgi:low affinity Fe/Cu permease